MDEDIHQSHQDQDRVEKRLAEYAELNENYNAKVTQKQQKLREQDEEVIGLQNELIQK